MNKVMKKDQVPAFLDGIAAKYQLIAPVKDESVILYKPTKSGQEVVLDMVNSMVSPKNAFFPQWETLYGYDTRNNDMKVFDVEEVGERVLFGVRPCDLMAILHMDPVFDGKFKDFYYQTKREKTVIIGVSCATVANTCFCTAYDNSPTSNKGADIMMYDLGDKYAVEFITEKGNKIADLFSKFLSDDANAPAAVEAKGKELAALCRPVDITGVKEKCDTIFENPYWEKLAQKCLNCGICTYVCPTCHCFDVFDEAHNGEGARYRCWDSCMFSDFTLAAGGHNPRPTKTERVRNRFMHKLKYHNDRYELSGCIGCGRCIAKCPVNLDITQIISEVKAVN